MSAGLPARAGALGGIGTHHSPRSLREAIRATDKATEESIPAEPAAAVASLLGVEGATDAESHVADVIKSLSPVAQKTVPLAGTAAAAVAATAAGMGIWQGGVTGSVQICFDLCAGELTVDGWIWGGVGYQPSFGGFYGAYSFYEKQFAKRQVMEPLIACGTCVGHCTGGEPAGGDEWGGGIAGFPIMLHPGKRAVFAKGGLELGLLLTPRGPCNADIEVILLLDLLGYLGPAGRAAEQFVEEAQVVARRLRISEPELTAGVDVSATIEVCKNADGGWTSPHARICGGGYIAGGFNLGAEKSALPR